MTKANIPDIQRPDYFTGQRLTAADLVAGQAFHRELRWLHARGLHSWGIAFGLSVSGNRGDGVVMVEPGYAVDCQGRDLVVDDSTTIPVPSVAGVSGKPASWYLTLSYQEDADRPVEQRGAGVCFDDGATRRSEGGLVRWQKSGDPRPGLDIILARGAILDCLLDAAVSTAERRDARPAQQPYVAVGSSEGATTWSAWKDAAGGTVGLKTRVDASAAGFGSTPRYLAHVIGDRVALQWGALKTTAAVDGFTSLADQDRNGFELRLFLPRGLTAGQGLPINPAAILDGDLPAAVKDWYVAWMGIEA